MRDCYFFGKFYGWDFFGFVSSFLFSSFIGSQGCSSGLKVALVGERYNSV